MPALTGTAAPDRRQPAPRSATQHPLGALLFRIGAERPNRVRVRAGIVLAGCVSLLLVAALLTPDPSGIGTHCQLGLPPCGLVMTTGIPCPTCGITTAFTHAIHGHIVKAFATQPFGALVALAAMASAGLSLAAVVTGKTWRINWYRVSPALVAATVVVLFAAAWVYKIRAVLAAGST